MTLSRCPLRIFCSRGTPPNPLSQPNLILSRWFNADFTGFTLTLLELFCKKASVFEDHVLVIQSKAGGFALNPTMLQTLKPGPSP